MEQTPCAFRDAQNASQAKLRLITYEKQKSFRRAVHEASQDDGIWGLVRWANGRSKGVATVPPLRKESGVATTTEEKSHAFRARFYPMTDADLSDIPDRQQLHPRTAFDPDLSLFPTAAFEISNFVSLEEIEEILGSKASFNAPGPDFIPFGFLKAMGPLLVQALQVVTNSCWTLGHFPARFKKARTVVIRKPGKKTYDEAGAWRPIALLSTFGKIIETLAAQKLQKEGGRR